MTSKSEVDELGIDDLKGLYPEMKRVIQERVQAKLVKNKEHAHRTLFTYQGLFLKMHSLLSTLTNVISNSVHVYLKLFTVSDYNPQRLVRSKMSSIFRPDMGLALNLGT